VNDASWSPGAPTQYVTPNPNGAGGSFERALVVQDAYGQTARATFAFSARASC